ncbi:MAG: carbamoyltransferase [bacterium]|nr:carbamoyltransferase [bacterium]MDZ4296569.1 carbamoyltransferase [Patescibacteria group bacterium]
MHILGISCFYHDSAACLVRDGVIVAAAQEERFSRFKHDERFPHRAIAYCLEEAGIKIGEVDYVAFYEKPIVKFDRILQTAIAFAPRGLGNFLKAMPLWLRHRLWVRETIARELPQFRGSVVFPSHHESHAASAFFPSPFAEAAILTLDAVGEWNSTTYGMGMGNTIKLEKAMNFPHSLGMLYSAFTQYVGFKVNSGEYKLMGLAPYGTPRFSDLILRELVDVRDDGSFRLNMEYFNYGAGLTMVNKRFEHLFGGPARLAEAPIEARHCDLAASIQAITNEIVLRLARHVRRVTGMSRCCMAGGVALNCVTNGLLHRARVFERIWIQPAAGDAGGALGAALMTWYQHLGNQRVVAGGRDAMQGALLGPSFGDEHIRAFLTTAGARFREFSEEELIDQVAQLLGQGKVVGWFQGRMEFGPRALGNRSILGDPRNAAMQSVMNVKIKFRESFRPLAPAVLEEQAGEYFEGAGASPYMLFTFPVHPARRLTLDAPRRSVDMDVMQWLKTARSTIPAVTHVDFSARVQTVSRSDNPLFYALIERFYQKTGCPLLINTSFNIRGEPIVATPEDALRCFLGTRMDYLAIGNFLVEKDNAAIPEDILAWQKTIAPD